MIMDQWLKISIIVFVAAEALYLSWAVYRDLKVNNFVKNWQKSLDRFNDEVAIHQTNVKLLQDSMNTAMEKFYADANKVAQLRFDNDRGMLEDMIHNRVFAVVNAPLKVMELAEPKARKIKKVKV